MAALATGNAQEQITELKALRHKFAGTGVFDFLGPKVPEATAANPTRLRVHCSAPCSLAVLVELPAAYPSDAPPSFWIEAPALEAAQVDALEVFLKEQASFMRGMACISATL